MRLLLFGRGGQVGWELQRSLAVLGELVALEAGDADFAEPESLAGVVRDVRPDAIVNAAAHTAVDRAEAEPARARLLNAEAPGVLAREAAAIGAWLVHYGTDYVFDGSGSEPRDETAATAPLSVYGRTKLDGEARIRASGCPHLILRTSWVYGARGGNFARTMVKLAGEHDRLPVVADQVGAPTGAELIADVTAHALRMSMNRPNLAGTYHVAAAGETSRHGYACFVVEWARAHGLPVRVQVLDPVPSNAWPSAAQRPLNSRLDTRKLQACFDLVLPPWQQGVARMLAEAFA